MHTLKINCKCFSTHAFNSNANHHMQTKRTQSNTQTNSAGAHSLVHSRRGLCNGYLCRKVTSMQIIFCGIKSWLSPLIVLTDCVKGTPSKTQKHIPLDLGDQKVQKCKSAPSFLSNKLNRLVQFKNEKCVFDNLRCILSIQPKFVRYGRMYCKEEFAYDTGTAKQEKKTKGLTV